MTAIPDSQLAAQLPAVFLPPLPPKQMFGRFEERFVFRRQKGLQRFVNRLHECLHTATHDAVLHFMTARTPAEFAEGVKNIGEGRSLLACRSLIARRCRADEATRRLEAEHKVHRTAMLAVDKSTQYVWSVARSVALRLRSFVA